MFKKIIFLGVLIVMGLSFTACWPYPSKCRIERLYGLKLPKEMKVEYDYFKQDFHGSFSQYTIFKLQEEPTDFLSSEFSYGGEPYAKVNGVQLYKPVVSGTLSFVEEHNSLSEKEFDEWLAHLKKPSQSCASNKYIPAIPQKYYPDWGNRYLRANVREMKIIYFPNELKLIFCISTP